MKIFVLVLILLLPFVSSATDEKEKVAVKGFAKKLFVLEKKGRDMEDLRMDPLKMPVCMERMRKLQPVVDKLREDAIVKFPGHPGMYFGAAALDLRFCVSCVSNALEKCYAGHAEILKGLGSLEEK